MGRLGINCVKNITERLAARYTNSPNRAWNKACEQSDPKLAADPDVG